MYEIVAMPLPLVFAVPTVLPSTLKVIVPPETGELLDVNVALRDTGPTDPAVTEAGLGAARAREVAAVTRRVPVVVGSAPPWQLALLAPVTVNV